jgi:hypothetical protein
MQKHIGRVVVGAVVAIVSGLFLGRGAPAQELSVVRSTTAEQAPRAEVIARTSEIDLQRDRELAAEVERLKQESAALRQAKAGAEARLSEQTRAHREDRELLAVIQQELFRALDEIEQLKKHSTAGAEKERESAAALRRELQATQRQVRQLRAGLAKQAQPGSQARADNIQSGNAMGSQPEGRPQSDH